MRGGVDGVRGARREEVVGPAAQRRPVLAGHPEQVADDLDGQRHGEVLDQVGRTAARGHPVQQTVRGLGHPRLQTGHRGRRERLDGQPAQPGVVRRVGGQHGGADGRGQIALGRLVGEVAGGVLGEPRLRHRGTGLGPPGDQPGRAVRPGPYLLDGAALAQRGEQRVRVAEELR